MPQRPVHVAQAKSVAETSSYTRTATKPRARLHTLGVCVCALVGEQGCLMMVLAFNSFDPCCPCDAERENICCAGDALVIVRAYVLVFHAELVKKRGQERVIIFSRCCLIRARS